MNFIRNVRFRYFLCAFSVIVVMFFIGNLFLKTMNSFYSAVTDETYMHLEKISGQMVGLIDQSIEEHWNLLESIENIIEKEKHDFQDENDLKECLSICDEFCGNENLMYIDADFLAQNCNGEIYKLELTNDEFRKFSDGKKFVKEDFYFEGKDSIIYIMPFENAFTISQRNIMALGLICTKAKLVDKLDVMNFNGEGEACIIKSDGRVIMTSNKNENVDTENVFISLKAFGEIISEGSWEDVIQKISVGKSDVLRCSFKEEDYYISYKKMMFEDWTLFFIVPTEAVNVSTNEFGGHVYTVGIAVALFVIFLLSIIYIYIFRKYMNEKNKEIKNRDKMFEILTNNDYEAYIMANPKTKKAEYISESFESVFGLTNFNLNDDFYECLLKTTLLNEAVLQELKEWDKKSSFKSSYCHYFNEKLMENRWFCLKIYSMKNDNGEERCIVNFSDVTAERVQKLKADKALDAAESANCAKNKFLFNMSHDIRTPMNAIMGMTDIALYNINDTVKVKECLNKIGISAKHLLTIINDVLEMSRIESGNLILNEENFDIKELIDETKVIVETQVEQKEQSFGIELDVKNSAVKGDSLHLQRVFLHILGNAIKYTKNGGSINLSVSEEEYLKEGYGYYKFVFSDTGVGISEDFIDKVFDSFERDDSKENENADGTGLGMAICKNIIELMNGEISVKSKEGEGSVFTVAVPLKQQKYEEQENNEEGLQEDIDFSGMRILIVEDKEINMEIAKEILKRTGIEIEEAWNGEEAVKKVSLSEENYYDLIFMDVQMPIMDGYKATEIIRGLDRDDVKTLPIAAMTANVFEEDVKRAFDVGMNLHISKPFNVNDLYSAMKRLLNISQKKASELDDEKY